MYRRDEWGRKYVRLGPLYFRPWAQLHASLGVAYIATKHHLWALAFAKAQQPRQWAIERTRTHTFFRLGSIFLCPHRPSVS